MNEIQIFNNAEFGQVRTITDLCKRRSGGARV